VTDGWSIDVNGQITVTGSASPSSSGDAKSSSKSGAVGMPTAGSGLIVSVVTVAALLGGVARVLA